jgi:dihydrofolate synthase / folylpolyglutamate synthase
MPIATYQQALDWLYSFVRYDKQRRTPGSGDLIRMERLLEHLGTPQARFPSVLIAGTKGKGSTAALLASILRAAGYRTGLYTSPHLHTFRERIQVNETLITREEIIVGAGRLERLISEFPDVIWFELVTALAFEHFARQQIDMAVLEVGLGGRLDPTNVVHSRVSVIAPISYDHTDVLGSTLTAIATEKAGIIKAETPVVSAPQEEEARAVIKATARDKNAPLVQVGADWKWEALRQNLDGQTFRVIGPHLDPLELFLPLLGQHQLVNATTALGAVNELQQQGWRVPNKALGAGLARVEWPVRFEVLARAPVIVADGAHNRAAAREIRRTLDELFPNAQVHLIFGASHDKDIAGMLDELLSPSPAKRVEDPRSEAEGRRDDAAICSTARRKAERIDASRVGVILTHSHHVRAAPLELLARLVERFQVPLIETTDVATALRIARERAGTEDVICVTGSLFVAAEARALIRKEQGLPVETDDQ